MKRKFGIISIVLSMVLVATASILGTAAYLTDRDDVVNTFTVGMVDIKLDEATVDENGVPDPSAPRTEDGNEYHLVPSVTYTKDPTLTVAKGSEASYIRMLVSVNYYSALSGIFDDPAKEGDMFELTDLVVAINPDWTYKGVTVKDDVATFEYRYKETVDTYTATEDLTLPALFSGIRVPEWFENDDLQLLYQDADHHLNMTIVGEAIQVVGHENDVDGAWAAFEIQNGKYQMQ